MICSQKPGPALRTVDPVHPLVNTHVQFKQGYRGRLGKGLMTELRHTPGRSHIGRGATPAAFRRLVAAFALVSLSCAAGCTGQKAGGGRAEVRPARDTLPAVAADALGIADRFELYSLKPGPLRKDADGTFHGYQVLGKTSVEDAATRLRLIDALKKGIAENDGRVAGCFNPRHRIRAVHGSKTVDVVVCFECFSAKIFVDGDHRSGFLTTASPQPDFDRVLHDATVPTDAGPSN